MARIFEITAETPGSSPNYEFSYTRLNGTNNFAPSTTHVSRGTQSYQANWVDDDRVQMENAFTAPASNVIYGHETLYVDSAAAASWDKFPVLSIRDNDAWSVLAKIRFEYDVNGDPRFWYVEDGNGNGTHLSDLEQGQFHRIEWRMDLIAAGGLEVRINGTTVYNSRGSVDLSGSQGASFQLITCGDAAQGVRTVWVDDIIVDDADWIGDLTSTTTPVPLAGQVDGYGTVSGVIDNHFFIDGEVNASGSFNASFTGSISMEGQINGVGTVSGNLVSPGDSLIIDNSNLGLFDSIPQSYIDIVKTRLLLATGESHRRAFTYGPELLESDDATYAVNVNIGESAPEADTSSHLRINLSYYDGTSWHDSCGEEDFWDNATARAAYLAGLQYIDANYSNPAYAFFGWCQDGIGLGGLADPVTGNRWGFQIYVP